MNRAIVAFLLATGLLTGPGCAVDAVDGPGGAPTRPVNFVGEVVYVPVEGGFHGIIDGNGHKLNPMNLDDSLKREGLVIEGAYQVRDDMVGIRQWGTIVELIHQQPVYGPAEG